MVCASVREDNPRASASGLSPVQTHEPYSNLLIAPVCICTLYITRYVRVKVESHTTIGVKLLNIYVCAIICPFRN